MAATRVTAATVLPNWQAVDDAGRELGEITRRVAAVEAKANEKVDAVRAKLAEDTAEDLGRKQRLEIDIKDFTEAHVGELDGRRKVLNFITVMLRRTSSLKPLPKWTWAKVLERLQQRGRREFIRVKEEPNKEAIVAADLAEKAMDDLGLRLVGEDSFSYELAEIEAQPT